MEEALGTVESKVNEEMLDVLSQSFTGEEVTRAVFQMHPCKAPSTYDMLAIFLS